MDASEGANHNGNGNGHKPTDPAPHSLPSAETPAPGGPVPSAATPAPAAVPPEPLVVIDSAPAKPVKLKRTQLAFLAAIEEGLTKSGACRAAKISRQSFYNWLEEVGDQADAFRAAFVEAFNAGTDSLIDEAKRRAKDGWDEPVFNHKTGERIGSIRRYDSKLLLALLGQRDPSFRQRQLEITGAGGSPLNPAKVEHKIKFDFSGLDADEVNDLYRKLQRSRVLPSAGN